VLSGRFRPREYPTGETNEGKLRFDIQILDLDRDETTVPEAESAIRRLAEKVWTATRGKTPKWRALSF
jgi:hypothetical protein